MRCFADCLAFGLIAKAQEIENENAQANVRAIKEKEKKLEYKFTQSDLPGITLPCGFTLRVRVNLVYMINSIPGIICPACQTSASTQSLRSYRKWEGRSAVCGAAKLMPLTHTLRSSVLSVTEASATKRQPERSAGSYTFATIEFHAAGKAGKN